MDSPPKPSPRSRPPQASPVADLEERKESSDIPGDEHNRHLQPYICYQSYKPPPLVYKRANSLGNLVTIDENQETKDFLKKSNLKRSQSQTKRIRFVANVGTDRHREKPNFTPTTSNRNTVSTHQQKMLPRTPNLTHKNDIKQFKLHDTVTLILRISGIHHYRSTCFVNCLTACGQRVVVMGFKENAVYLVQLEDMNDILNVIFTHVEAVDVRHTENTDVEYDFIFTNSSKFQITDATGAVMEPYPRAQHSPQNEDTNLELLLRVDELTLKQQIQLMQLSQVVTLKLKVRSIHLSRNRNQCFVNCFTGADRVVVMSFGKKAADLARLEAQLDNDRDQIVKFIKVEAVTVVHKNNTDVRFDFIFLSTSTWEFVGTQQLNVQPPSFLNESVRLRPCTGSNSSRRDGVDNTAPSSSRSVHSVKDRLATKAEIDNFTVGKNVTVILKIESVLLKTWSCRVNCLTADDRKLIVVGFWPQTNILAKLTDVGELGIVKFVDVVTIIATDKNSSDAEFDFRFENQSKLETFKPNATETGPLHVNELSPNRLSFRIAARPPSTVQSIEEVDYVATTNDIDLMKLDDVVTLVLLLNSVIPKPRVFSCFVNCFTSNNNKVVVLETGNQRCDLTSLVDQKNVQIVKFTNVKAVDKTPSKNSEVKFDFKFLKFSKFEIVPVLTDFSELQKCVDRHVKVIAQVNYFVATSGCLIIESGSGDTLIAKYLEGSALLSSDGRPKQVYLFEGFVKNINGMELHVGKTPIPVNLE